MSDASSTISAISQMLKQIACELDQDANANPKRIGHPHHHSSQTPQSLETLSLAKAYIASRRKRDHLFAQQGLFADPAWDMLVDLYIHHLEGRTVSVSSLCIASAVPATTALRWINRLADDGFVIRSPDPTDARRILVKVSTRSALLLERYFTQFFPR